MSSYIQAKKDEEGFTLIELLVVVIIIGILAAIAIPVFLNQRENAWRGSAESDARNAAIQVESVMTATRDYPADASWDNADGANPAYYIAADGSSSTTAAASDVGEVSLSDGVVLDYEVAADGNSFTIVASHDNIAGETITYDSAAGGLANSWDR